jgi:hypothetical protein
MKKTFLFFAAAIALTLGFSACKKTKESTTQKIQHNWTVVSEVDNSHDASGDHLDTVDGISGDFINFNSNGTVTLQFDGSTETGTYTLVNDNELSMGGEVYTIKSLNDSQLILYIKDVSSATDYDETTINMKR